MEVRNILVHCDREREREVEVERKREGVTA